MNNDVSFVSLENAIESLVETREKYDLWPDMCKMIDNTLANIRLILALKSEMNTSANTDTDTDTDTINADAIRDAADTLANLHADVRATLRSHADTLDALDSEGNARQLAQKLMHDYLDIAHALDASEEREKMHRMQRFDAEASLWEYKYTRYTTEITNATKSIADALDMLHDMIDSLSVFVFDFGNDALSDAYATMNAINEKQSEISDLAQHLASLA